LRRTRGSYWWAPPASGLGSWSCTRSSSARVAAQPPHQQACSRPHLRRHAQHARPAGPTAAPRPSQWWQRPLDQPDSRLPHRLPNNAFLEAPWIINLAMEVGIAKVDTEEQERR
jgi:hypothetical protein